MKTKFLFFIVILLIACNTDAIDETDYTPKPKAFIKLNFPEKVYEKLNVDCPFSFEIANYSVVVPTKKNCLFDIDFPKLNGKLHITYLPLNDNLQEHTEESRALALKHIIVADGVKEDLIIKELDNVYGVLYDYKGMTATSTQFYLTDSVNHFFRGALYFNTAVSDSILPINLFLKYDIKHLIETFYWKDK